MSGAERRRAIAASLNSHEPVSGAELARRLGVSRQVIVQDVALMRAEDKSILSTNKGYLLYDPNDYAGSCRRVVHVQHTTEETLDELLTITELGGQVLDVMVEHEIYGQLRADLLIHTPQDARDFCRRLSASAGAPLKTLTADRHYHTILASTEHLLDLIEQELREKGFLVDG